MAVKVFFESKQHSELVAVFDSEDLYNFLFDTWIDSGCP